MSNRQRLPHPTSAPPPGALGTDTPAKLDPVEEWLCQVQASMEEAEEKSDAADAKVADEREDGADQRLRWTPAYPLHALRKRASRLSGHCGS